MILEDIAIGQGTKETIVVDVGGAKDAVGVHQVEEAGEGEEEDQEGVEVVLVEELRVHCRKVHLWMGLKEERRIMWLEDPTIGQWMIGMIALNV